MTPSIRPLKIGAVLFPGFELLDIYGPLEMLALLGDRVSITMIAEEAGAVASSAGVKGFADLPLREASGLDLLIVPGGIGTRALVENQKFLDLLQQRLMIANWSQASALVAHY